MTMACFSGKGHGKNMSCYVMRVFQFLQCLFVELFLVQKNVLLHHLATMVVMLFCILNHVICNIEFCSKFVFSMSNPLIPHELP